MADDHHDVTTTANQKWYLLLFYLERYIYDIYSDAIVIVERNLAGEQLKG